MIECIDYVLKIEILLILKMVLKVRVVFFINLIGRLGYIYYWYFVEFNNVIILNL